MKRGSFASPLSYLWLRHALVRSSSRQVRPGMYFPFNCLGCGHENHAGWSQIGQRFWCRACGRSAIVPAPMEPVVGGPAWQFAVRFACPVCGRSFATKPALVGRKIRCSGCQAGVRVPEANSFPVEHASRIALNGLSGSNRAIAPATGRSSNVTPAAGDSISRASVWWIPREDNSGISRSIAPAIDTPVQAPRSRPESEPSLSHDQLEAIGSLTRRERAAVVLTSRGEMMEQVQQEAAKQEAAEVAQIAEKAKKAKKKRRKKTGFFDLKETLTMLGGVAVVVAALGFVAWRFPESRFPLAGLLVVIGTVLYLLGAMSLSRVAAHESFLKAMAFRFFPPYQMWYVVMHWQDTQDFFAFFVSGLLIVAIGLGVFRTSRTFVEAEQSNREYQIAVDEAVHGKLAKPLAPLTDKTAEPKNQ